MTKNKQQTIINDKCQTMTNIKQGHITTNNKQRRFPPYNRLEENKPGSEFK